MSRLPSLLLAGVLPLALAACSCPGPATASPVSPPPLGTDLGGSGPVVSRMVEPPATPARGEMQMAHAGHTHAQGTGTVNSVDAANHKINISHNPIPAIGFPSMTMDFAVAPGVNLSTLKPGMRVNFTVEQGAGGMYEIQSMTPAGGAQ